MKVSERKGKGKKEETRERQILAASVGKRILPRRKGRRESFGQREMVRGIHLKRQRKTRDREYHFSFLLESIQNH